MCWKSSRVSRRVVGVTKDNAELRVTASFDGGGGKVLPSNPPAQTSIRKYYHRAQGGTFTDIVKVPIRAFKIYWYLLWICCAKIHDIHQEQPAVP